MRCGEALQPRKGYITDIEARLSQNLPQAGDDGSGWSIVERSDSFHGVSMGFLSDTVILPGGWAHML